MRAYGRRLGGAQGRPEGGKCKELGTGVAELKTKDNLVSSKLQFEFTVSDAKRQ